MGGHWLVFLDMIITRLCRNPIIKKRLIYKKTIVFQSTFSFNSFFFLVSSRQDYAMVTCFACHSENVWL